MNQNTILLFIVLVFISFAVQCDRDRSEDKFNDSISSVVMKAYRNGYFDGADAFRRSRAGELDFKQQYQVDSLQMQEGMNEIVESY